MTNVQPGQLAMFKPGCGENSGRLVRVHAREPLEKLLQQIKPGVWWSCEALQSIRRFASSSGDEKPPFAPGQFVAIPDAVLMPLHDGDGQDESLTWTAKPTSGDPVHQIIEEHAES